MTRFLMSFLLFFLATQMPVWAEAPSKVFHVKSTEDFQVDGAGTAPAWDTCEWAELQKREEDGLPYEARFKMLYSSTGIYVLMEGTDEKLTTTMKEDFLHLWEEDVFEFFFWTDEKYPIYFEYEISPMNYELPILVPNFNKEFLGWRPWRYEGVRRTRKATTAIDGKKESGATVKGWMAEVYVPYSLLSPLRNVPPVSGTHWRANFYRIDYDNPEPTSWDWARVGSTFHDFENFGTLIFQ